MVGTGEGPSTFPDAQYIADIYSFILIQSRVTE